jgi:beta-glucosidase
LIANAEDTTTSEETSEEEVEEAAVTIRDLIGKSYNDPLWDTLLDEITFAKQLELFNKGGFQTIELLDIGKPRTNDSDGPVGWTNFMDPETYYDTCSYASECVLGATWNTELLYKMGVSVGNEALVGDKNGVPYTCWYAPAVNIHRSAFGGRNFEYFSEDGYFSGMMASAEIQGAMTKGVNTQIKHFALNEQETHRSSNGVLTWATEQSMRELYLKPFEYAVKVGGTRGVMSSFNRIGTKWAGGDYRLLTTILRNEWGFNGIVISDYNDGTVYMNPKQMAYAGGNLNLATRQDFYWTNAKETDATDVAVLRENTKGILYAIANSNALNVDIKGYGMPTWQIIMYVVDAVLVAGLAAWGILVIRKVFSKEN